MRAGHLQGPVRAFKTSKEQSFTQKSIYLFSAAAFEVAELLGSVTASNLAKQNSCSKQ